MLMLMKNESDDDSDAVEKMKKKHCLNKKSF